MRSPAFTPAAAAGLPVPTAPTTSASPRLSIQMPLAVRDQAADAIRDLTHGRAAITKAP